MRFIGMDVHRDFCEVAILRDGKLRSAPQVPTRPSALRAFAQELEPTDVVALENTRGGFLPTASRISQTMRAYLLSCARFTRS